MSFLVPGLGSAADVSCYDNSGEHLGSIRILTSCKYNYCKSTHDVPPSWRNIKRS